MDYVGVFQNLKTNNKYGRKSPHKAVLMLTVIELYEQNVLSDNEIYYDDTLKSTFLKVWNRVLPEEPLFHPDAYLPFWYLQSDSFWHIVPQRGKEDILSLMRDHNIKPSEAKLNDCVNYAELDDDLYFLMTLPSGRSSLKRVLLETYTNLPEEQIGQLAESPDSSIDFSVAALSDYEKILSNVKNEKDIVPEENNNELVRQFQRLNEDIQIVLNLQYFSFLKSHRNEREMFKEVCPTVYDLLDKIVNHPIQQADITPSFAFTYDNFLSDLKIALMSEEDSMDLIDKIADAINLLRGMKTVVESNERVEYNEITNSISNTPIHEEETHSVNAEPTFGDTEVEHVYLDSHGEIVDKLISYSIEDPKRNFATENRKGKPWTKEEEEIITRLFNQGRDASLIASIIGRTEVAIKARLAKLGLIEYTYGQDEQTSVISDEDYKRTDEGDFTIENSFTSCSIKDKNGERVFSSEGKLKYINGKLYRLNQKRECFTLKSMLFNGEVWIKGDKKIVAYPQTELYRMMGHGINNLDDVEDIVDSPVFENCKLKVKGVWYKYNGGLISDVSTLKDESKDSPEQNSDKLRIIKNPLYAERKQAVLRAMSFFRLPAKIKDIARTISRTAWGSTIREEEVEEVMTSMSEVEFVDGKYVLRTRLKKEVPLLHSDITTKSTNEVVSLSPQRKTNVTIGTWIQLKPTGSIGKVVGFRYSGALQKIVIRMKNGQEEEVYDNPKTYEIIMA